MGSPTFWFVNLRALLCEPIVLFENTWIVVSNFLYARCILLSTFDFLNANIEAYKSSLAYQLNCSHRIFHRLSHARVLKRKSKVCSECARSSGAIEILRYILFSKTFEMQRKNETRKNRHAFYGEAVNSLTNDVAHFWCMEIFDNLRSIFLLPSFNV